ncbi:flagellar protein FlaG [Paraglaciecola sp. L1A13]|uniref:flagellar protein FlaG n=1 Tax=Paraglaciecola sp. L1A13 TaxID=2686359 RepID=UPI00131D0734|nr:flagellar protein FlaG [Paraglaciecola sp. L1A13]|tara:strand:- start:70728 stop:71150 length:423 start_codon:yes stop_codon:yes gene_type:complete
MDIGISQVGQNFAINSDLKQLNNEAKEDLNLFKKQSVEEVKDIALLADKDIQEQIDFELSDKVIDSAIADVNEFVQTKNRQLNFSVDEGSGRQVVKVTDSQSGDVIRQIPTEEVLNFSKRIKELQTDVSSAVGMFVNKQA